VPTDEQLDAAIERLADAERFSEAERIVARAAPQLQKVLAAALAEGGWFGESHEAEALESVVRKAGSSVHLVGHSFGGLVALAVALRNQVSLSSLVILEAPAMELLRAEGENRHYSLFQGMTEAYFADFASGNVSAIAAMIDFYGGPGTFASWPPRVRAYAERTTPVDIVDWGSAYGLPLSAASLSTIRLPVIVARGGASHPAMQRANALLSERIDQAALVTIDGAAHFMIATHATEVADLIAQHVARAEYRQTAQRHIGL